MSKLARWIVLLVVVLLPLLAHAQMLDPVSFTVTEAPSEVKSGEIFKVTIEAKIEGNWHLYSVHNDPDAGPFPTQFSTPGEALQITGKIEESEPVIKYDPNFDVELGWHNDQAQFTIPLKITKAPSSKVKLDILYQVCNDRACLPPKTKTIALPISVDSSVSITNSENSTEAENPSPAPVKKKDSPALKLRGAGSTTPRSPTLQNFSDGALSGAGNTSAQSEAEQLTPVSTSRTVGDGIFSFIWIAILAGFTALLTPCVFPMIPFTVAYFSKQGQGVSGSGNGAGQA